MKNDNAKVDFDTEFKPTPKELALLVELANPENFSRTIPEICSIAKCGKDVYFRGLQKKGFIELKNKLVKDAIKDNMDKLYKACFEYATSNPKNYKDRELLFQMYKEFVPKQEIKQEINIVEQMSDDEIKTRITELVGKGVL